MYVHSSTDMPRFSSTDYVKSFARKIERTEGRTIRGHHLGEALHLQELLHIPENTASKTMLDMQTGEYFWGVQKLALVASNLGRGKGFVWYFICNGCRRRVKYLYEESTMRSPLCRHCCGFRYSQPSRKSRRLSRLLNKAYVSPEDKKTLIRLMGLTREDFSEEVLP